MRVTARELALLACVLTGLLMPACARRNAKPISQPDYQAMVTAQLGGIAQPPEIAKTSFPADTLTLSPEDKKLREELFGAMNLKMDIKDTQRVQESIKALREIINGHPDYADVRSVTVSLSLLVGDTDYSQMLGNLDTAMQVYSLGKHRSVFESEAPLYALRAKIREETGDYAEAISDLIQAIKIDPATPLEVLGVNGTKPNKRTEGDLWGKQDFDKLIGIFPTDYRVYLLRGYFYSAFTTFSAKYPPLAAKDYERAVSLDGNPPLSYYLLGNLYEHAQFWSRAAWADLSGRVRNGFNRRVVEYMTSCISRDSLFKDAYISRAEAYYSLGDFGKAISDYNRIIELDPNYGPAYNDRGLAESNLGQYYKAVDDFGKAINKKNHNFFTYLTYKNRADAELKAHELRGAIEDYTNAIGILVGQNVLLMNVAEFRNLYPEYNEISDSLLVRMLWQKFDANLGFDSFANGLLYENKTSTLPTDLYDLYIGRVDAFLLSNNIRDAATDYHRITIGMPYCSEMAENDRWRLYGKDLNNEFFVDLKSIDFARAGVVDVWIKIMNGNGYQLENYAINCPAKQIKTLSAIRYDAVGNVISQSAPQKEWVSVVPGSFGERLLEGLSN